VPAGENGDLQTLICVLLARPRRCLTLLNPVPWQNWMAAYLVYTLQMKTLFRGWPVMVNDAHTSRRRLSHVSVLYTQVAVTSCGLMANMLTNICNISTWQYKNWQLQHTIMLSITEYFLYSQGFHSSDRSRDTAVWTPSTNDEKWLSRDNSPHSSRRDAKKSTTPSTSNIHANIHSKTHINIF